MKVVLWAGTDEESLNETSAVVPAGAFSRAREPSTATAPRTSAR